MKFDENLVDNTILLLEAGLVPALMGERTPHASPFRVTCWLTRLT